MSPNISSERNADENMKDVSDKDIQNDTAETMPE